MSEWLIEHGALASLREFHKRGLTPSAVERGAYEARRSSEDGILRVQGAAGIVPIHGILTEKMDFFAWLFGGGNTVYSDIVKAIQLADADPRVSEIVLDINSPGGTVAGLFSAIDAINAANKPVRAEVTTMAASAAYALASQASEIVAVDRSAMFGSIGVVSSFWVDPEIVSVTSTDAPNKRPDVTTSEGRAIVREELDAIHELFVGAIAEGRGITPKKVNSTFGKGSMFLAAEALSRGMIDSEKTSTPTTAVVLKQETQMDLQTLKAQHPAVYTAARDEGANAERERVTAHLTMGEASGDMKTTVTAIKDGSDLTPSLQAAHLAAAMNRAAVASRVADDAAASIAATQTATSDTNTEADQVAALVARNLGGTK